MDLKRLSIRRADDYGYGRVDPSKPFVATIEMEGVAGNVTLNLDPAMSKRILDIVSDEVAAAGRATAEAMVASVLNGSTKALAA